MKKQVLFKLFAIGLFIAMALISCNNNKEEPSDLNDDDIHLTTHAVKFPISGGETTVATEGVDWWLSGFVDSETYAGIKNFMSKTGEDPTVFTYEWISVSKSGRKGIYIKVEPNTTGKSRSIKVSAMSGNFQDYITVTQD